MKGSAFIADILPVLSNKAPGGVAGNHGAEHAMGKFRYGFT